MKKPVALRIPDHLLSLADLRARKERVDKAAALRQILYEGAESYVLRLLSRGELSLSRAGELLGLSPGEVQDLAVQRGVEIGGTLAQHRAGR
jgi:predicted HTH domain antitoxin